MKNKDMDEILDGLFMVLPVFRKKVLKIGEDILRDKEISRAHLQIMKNLSEFGPSSMTDLGKMLSVSKPNITTLVDRLVELGFVIRKVDDKDRRIIFIELTNQGKDYFLRIVGNMKDALSKRMEKFTEADLKLFKETIGNMKILILRMVEEEY